MDNEGWVPVRVIAGFRRVSGSPSSFCSSSYSEADMFYLQYNVYSRKYILLYKLITVVFVCLRDIAIPTLELVLVE